MELCPSCNEDASQVSHRCRDCGRRCHAFCGESVTEGYASLVICAGCAQPRKTPSAIGHTDETAAIARAQPFGEAAKTPQASTLSGATTTPTPHTLDDAAAILRTHTHNDAAITQLPHTLDVGATVPPAHTLDDGAATPRTLSNQESGSKRKRVVQIVSTVAQRRLVVRWMMARHAEGATKLPSAAVRQFPDIFRAVNVRSNVQKASDWWKRREEVVAGSGFSITQQQAQKAKRMNAKARPGRGRKRSKWVVWIYDKLYDEFRRLQKLGVKLSRALLGVAARHIIESSDAQFNSSSVDEKDGILIIKKITTRWVQSFCENHDIVKRSQCGKKSVNAKKTESIHRAVAYHLGEVKRQFDSGELDEDSVANMDETHFVVDMDNGKTLGLKGQEEIKYMEVVSGGEGMTMVVKLTGGVAAKLATPMMIFQNDKSSYPIRGVKDNVPGVCYRSQPKGWMDRVKFNEWVQDVRCNPTLPGRRKQVIYVDNASGHGDTTAMKTAAASRDIEIRYFPPNSTHLCQPADTFVIQKIKDLWRDEWERTKYELTVNGQFSNKPDKAGRWSGKLNNPGKPYFLRLAAHCVREANEKITKGRNSTPMNYARKAMILCGLAKDVDGVWKEEQLKRQLRDIIDMYRDNFNGVKPVEFIEEEEEDQSEGSTGEESGDEFDNPSFRALLADERVEFYSSDEESKDEGDDEGRSAWV